MRTDRSSSIAEAILLFVLPGDRRGEAGLICRVELAHPPGEESREPELHDRSPDMIGRALEQAVDGTERLDRDRGIRLRAVVDQPLGARVHRLEHLEPTLVVGGQEVDKLGLELERLAVRLAAFGLAHRVQQHLDRLRVASLSRSRAHRPAPPLPRSAP
jgi:hypothetical protein